MTLVRIDSSYRTSGQISNFRVNLDRAIEYNKVELLSIEIPNTIYPISIARRTNYLRLTQIGTPDRSIQITLPDGNYTYTSLASTLQTLLNSAVNSNGNYTVTYSVITGKITIS